MPTPPLAPLHAEPAPPVLESQSALAQGADGLAELAQWRYVLRYRAEHAAQDEVIVTVSFNTPSPGDATAADAPPRADRRYRLQLDYGEAPDTVQAVRLTREFDAAGTAGDWPDLEYRPASGDAIALGTGEGDAATRRYPIDPPQPSPYGAGIGLSWNRLGTAEVQNARASLAVVRNGNLGQQFLDEPIRRTATVDAPQVVAPSNRWTQDVAIDTFGGNLEHTLAAVFRQAFGPFFCGLRVRVGLDYGFRVDGADAPTPLISYVPVVLAPVDAITAATAGDIAAAAARWQDATAPSTRDARWRIALAQFSQIDPRLPQPLVLIESLIGRL